MIFGAENQYKDLISKIRNLMNLESQNTVGYRYERKFIVSELSKHQIEALIKLHPAVFSEIYHPRFINNLYLDTLGRKNYFGNIDGLTTRAKVRIRWYGDLLGYVEKPVLEFKYRRGSVGRKEIYPIRPFFVDSCLQLESVLDVFEKSDLPDDLKLNLMLLEFSLLNRYSRKYFQSMDGRYRITVDTGMECYFVQGNNNTFLNKSIDFINTIVELKYDLGEDACADQIICHFPFRITKSSKYVNGVEKFYLW
jgi:hypothetical protein